MDEAKKKLRKGRDKKNSVKKRKLRRKGRREKHDELEG